VVAAVHPGVLDEPDPHAGVAVERGDVDPVGLLGEVAAQVGAHAAVVAVDREVDGGGVLAEHPVAAGVLGMIVHWSPVSVVDRAVRSVMKSSWDLSPLSGILMPVSGGLSIVGSRRAWRTALMPRCPMSSMPGKIGWGRYIWARPVASPSSAVVSWRPEEPKSAMRPR
jgi:hypothetical protein